MNKVILMGRLTKTPEVETSKSGNLPRSGQDQGQTREFSRFTLAVDCFGEREADFISCTAFGTTANTIARHCDKGTKILVEGRLNVRNCEDKEGNFRTYTNVVVERFEFCESKRAGERLEADKRSKEHKPIYSMTDLEDNGDDKKSRNEIRNRKEYTYPWSDKADKVWK